MSSSVIITMDSLSKRFSDCLALDNITADIYAGEITGLVGPDGAGKTTLIRLMTGLLQPDTGILTVLGHDPQHDATVIHSEIGYMPQRFGLYEDLTVVENLCLYADLKGLPLTERESIFTQLLIFTNLQHFTRRLAGRLSGGMKQKLGLACALLKKPRLLLLDEPGVGVDPISRRELWKMVQALVADGVGVIWSTAYLDEAEACSRVLLLNAGKLLFAGNPQELTSRATGQVFKITVAQNKRETLTNLLTEKGVIDLTVQGAALRLVMDNPALPVNLPAQAQAEPTAPRFEDSFMILLGGGPKGQSRLAEQVRPRPVDKLQVIEAQGLTCRFGDFTAASDISFTVPRGEIFGLLGPNGAGKSTTFKMLCGLLKPTAGTGKVAGCDLHGNSAEARNRLGYMAQKFSLYGDLSVRQNLDFFASVYGLSWRERRKRITLMLDLFALVPYTRQSSKELPLGMKQRLALACAVMHEPDVLFLDEPTSGVDPITRREFWLHINGLVNKGVSVLVTTHFMDEAEYCDRVALIYQGQVIALATPDQLKAQVRSKENIDPTLEDAFIELIQRRDVRRLT